MTLVLKFCFILAYFQVTAYRSFLLKRQRKISAIVHNPANFLITSHEPSSEEGYIPSSDIYEIIAELELTDKFSKTDGSCCQRNITKIANANLFFSSISDWKEISYRSISHPDFRYDETSLILILQGASFLFDPKYETISLRIAR